MMHMFSACAIRGTVVVDGVGPDWGFRLLRSNQDSDELQEDIYR
jgi:hypothetical protein